VKNTQTTITNIGKLFDVKPGLVKLSKSSTSHLKARIGICDRANAYIEESALTSPLNNLNCKARHSSQRACQDVAQRSDFVRIRMASNWRTTKSRMAPLCNSSVCHLSLSCSQNPDRIQTEILCGREHPHPFLFIYVFSPEPHILLFRRPLGTDPQTGEVDPKLLRAAREEYKNQFGLRK
jgi:hypothetical protein